MLSAPRARLGINFVPQCNGNGRTRRKARSTVSTYRTPERHTQLALKQCNVLCLREGRAGAEISEAHVLYAGCSLTSARTT